MTRCAPFSADASLNGSGHEDMHESPGYVAGGAGQLSDLPAYDLEATRRPKVKGSKSKKSRKKVTPDDGGDEGRPLSANPE